jgi:hypothetical protein
MSRLRFTATLDMNAWRSCGIKSADNLILLAYPSEAKNRVRTELTKLNQKNIELELEGKDPVELDVEIDIMYKPRSLDANRLMFLQYRVLADIMNAEAKTMNRITADELYEHDMKDWATKHKIRCDNTSLPFIVEILEEKRGHIRSKEWDGTEWVMEVWQTSSYWDTKQQSEHIDRLFDLLETMGKNRSNNGDVARIYDDFKNWKKKESKNGERDN